MRQLRRKLTQKSSLKSTAWGNTYMTDLGDLLKNTDFDNHVTNIQIEIGDIKGSQAVISNSLC